MELVVVVWSSIPFGAPKKVTSFDPHRSFSPETPKHAGHCSSSLDSKPRKEAWQPRHPEVGAETLTRNDPTRFQIKNKTKQNKRLSQELWGPRACQAKETPPISGNNCES